MALGNQQDRHQIHGIQLALLKFSGCCADPLASQSHAWQSMMVAEPGALKQQQMNDCRRAFADRFGARTAEWILTACPQISMQPGLPAGNPFISYTEVSEAIVKQS